MTFGSIGWFEKAGVKLQRSTEEREKTFGSSSRKVRKKEGLRNRYSTVCLHTLYKLYICLSLILLLTASPIHVQGGFVLLHLSSSYLFVHLRVIFPCRLGDHSTVLCFHQYFPCHREQGSLPPFFVVSFLKLTAGMKSLKTGNANDNSSK